MKYKDDEVILQFELYCKTMMITITKKLRSVFLYLGYYFLFNHLSLILMQKSF